MASHTQFQTQMSSCYFSFSSLPRIPHRTLQALMSMGFKIGKDESDNTSFEKSNPSRSSIISLFDLIGFHDEGFDIHLSTAGYGAAQRNDAMPSLEPFTFVGGNNWRSDSFEVLQPGIGARMTEPRGTVFQDFSHEMNVAIEESESERYNEGGSINVGKKAKKAAEENNYKKYEDRNKNVINRREMHKKDVGQRQDTIIREETIQNKKFKEEDETNEEEEDETDEEEEDDEASSTFLFGKSMFELFQKRFCNSRIFESITTTEGFRGSVSVSVKNREGEVLKEIIGFHRNVKTKKVSGTSNEISKLMQSLKWQFDKHTVLDCDMGKTCLSITAHEEMFKEIKRQHPSHF